MIWSDSRSGLMIRLVLIGADFRGRLNLGGAELCLDSLTMLDLLPPLLCALSRVLLAHGIYKGIEFAIDQFRVLH